MSNQSEDVNEIARGLWEELGCIADDELCVSKIAAALTARDARAARTIEDLRERVGFIESKVDIEDMPDSYGWAVNELTARKAYSKSECATLLAEQRELAARAADAVAAERALVEPLLNAIRVWYEGGPDFGVIEARHAYIAAAIRVPR